MRSELGHDGQACLPLDLSEAEAHPAPRSTRRSPGPDAGVDVPFRHRLTTDVLASLGWPAGTELTLVPRSTPRRGRVMLARQGVELRVGVFAAELGRAVLRTDHGSVWIGSADEFLGEVTMASPPFTGMPGRREKRSGSDHRGGGDEPRLEGL